MADALLRCERANSRLRSALAVPPSDPDHAYLHSWVVINGVSEVMAPMRVTPSSYSHPPPICGVEVRVRLEP
eukprot:1727327-Pleurochrysis_carterae.AAC.1